MLNPKIHHYLTVQWILQWIVPPYTFGSGCMPSKWQFWWWEWWTMIIYNDKEWNCEHPVFRQTHLEVYHQVPVGKSYFAPIQAPIQCQFRCHSTSVDGVNFHFAKPPLESLQGMWTRFSEKLVGGLNGELARGLPTSCMLELELGRRLKGSCVTWPPLRIPGPPRFDLYFKATELGRPRQPGCPGEDRWGSHRCSGGLEWLDSPSSWGIVRRCKKIRFAPMLTDTIRSGRNA
jgi:hypothetical protein